jgi:hypothetical protein
MQVNEPAREHIRRNLENAIDRLNQDFERVEYWAAVLDAFGKPVPGYEQAHCDFLLHRED